jgi:hypothetical protein
VTVQTAVVLPNQDHGVQFFKSVQLLKNAAKAMATTTAPTELMMLLMMNALPQVSHAVTTHSKPVKMMESTSDAKLNAAINQKSSAQPQTAVWNHTLAAPSTQPSTLARVTSMVKLLNVLMLTTVKTTSKMNIPNAVTQTMATPGATP